VPAPVASGVVAPPSLPPSPNAMGGRPITLEFSFFLFSFFFKKKIKKKKTKDFK
jgi:hypothetical protein